MKNRAQAGRLVFLDFRLPVFDFGLLQQIPIRRPGSEPAGFQPAISNLKPAMPHIRAIIFDIGNVLTPFSYAPLVAEVAQRTGRDEAELFAMTEALRHAYETGSVATPEFLAQLDAATDGHFTRDELARLWEGIFTENEPMTALARWFGERLPVFLLSNTNALHLDYLRRTFPVFSIFRGGVYSHIVGTMKPDPRIYAAAERELKVRPAETLFIDDMPANIAAARTHGFIAELYDLRVHAAFLEKLETLGLQLPD
jgi:glucose-1-phosphatase